MDASIIEAPSSTKNRGGERDPEMRPVVFWDEGAIGVDANRSGTQHD